MWVIDRVTDIAINKITMMSLNINHFRAWRPYKLCPYKKTKVYDVTVGISQILVKFMTLKALATK